MQNSIIKVLKAGMCIGCGACELVCDSKAIEIVYNRSIGIYQPQINNNKCNDCGNCLDVCFGNNVDYKLSNILSEQLKSTFGKHIKTYLGFANNPEIRNKASSGGIVPALLEFLFDKGIINGAIVVKVKPGRIPFARSMIIKNKTDIKTSMGSKYCPVLISKALRDLEEKGNYALIGLPCQVYTIKKLISKKKLRAKISIIIGILCGGVPSYNGTKYLMKKYNLGNKTIKKIKYRGNGWPGRLYIETKSDFLELPFIQYWPIISPWFTLRRCETCLSGLNIAADISCGDAWLPEVMKEDKKGTSVIVSRTKAGNDLLNKAISENYINVQPISPKKFLKSQNAMLDIKHRRFLTRLKVLKLLRKKNLFYYTYRNQKYSINLKYFLDEVKMQIGKLLAQREKNWPIFNLYIKILNYFFFLVKMLKAKLNRKRSLHKPD